MNTNKCCKKLVIVSIAFILFFVACKKSVENPPIEYSNDLSNGALFVLSYQWKKILVLDRITLEEITKPIETEEIPYCLLVDNENKLLYIADWYPPKLTAIDIETMTEMEKSPILLSNFDLMGDMNLLINKKTNLIYVQNGSNVYLIDRTSLVELDNSPIKMDGSFSLINENLQHLYGLFEKNPRENLGLAVYDAENFDSLSFNVVTDFQGFIGAGFRGRRHWCSEKYSYYFIIDNNRDPIEANSKIHIFQHIGYGVYKEFYEILLPFSPPYGIRDIAVNDAAGHFYASITDGLYFFDLETLQPLSYSLFQLDAPYIFAIDEQNAFLYVGSTTSSEIIIFNSKPVIFHRKSYLNTPRVHWMEVYSP